MAPSPLYSSPDWDSRSQEKIKQLSDCGVDSTIFACDICEKSALGQAYLRSAPTDYLLSVDSSKQPWSPR